MSRGAERDPLRWLRDIRLFRVVRGDESGNVDQHVGRSRFSSARIDGHSASFSHTLVSDEQIRRNTKSPSSRNVHSA